ncbi:membrane fusion protein, multidrug efflux system [Luteibacter sp. UNCMF331Sha3.1]|uniref:efflux RND transporter periplasmic adaptor subunit n=1 Tax=Luteibacter sp. UNCMF331Sha3.1 TaxID=1502760 RepID=UPI0008C1525B|nr:efflux RND transporter periplasmic adaptor subunit [Luteibacter sp. UNCMF331Sha3.1]SEN10967.1 membrane fusion protein, multidrug efflux system [Luteibacter sp. UNCMF331Sha3.1]
MPGLSRFNLLAMGTALLPLVAALAACGSKPAGAAQAGPPDVDVAVVGTRTVTDWQAYSGRLQAINRIDIRALVPGTIMAVYFRDGQSVRKGDALFLIDPRTYTAAVDRATAQLAAARARQRFTTLDYARSKKLLDGNAISRRDFDDRANASFEADANVKAAEAAVESAKVDLGYTKIVAPVDGRMSRAEQTVGNIVSAGYSSPVLSTLVSMNPIYAGFDVDESTYLRYLSKETQSVPVRMGLASDDGFPRTGTIDSIDNEVSHTAGTIRVRARFDNADGALLPGLYTRVMVGGSAPHAAVLIDDRAVSTDQAKKFVLVVDDKQHAQYREVTLGPVIDGLRVVQNGLKPGERIVVSGLQRVHPGDPVKPNAVAMAGESTVADAK